LSDAWILNNRTESETAVFQNEFPSMVYSEDIYVQYDNMVDKFYDIESEQESLREYIDAFQKALHCKTLSVPHLQQGNALPNGCEAVCATMLLQYNGFTVSPETLVDMYLPCEQVKIRWGCRYGPNPAKAYAGDPRSKKGGWGCFAPVIIDALNAYLPNGYYAVNLTGKSLQELAVRYVAVDIPVAVWVTQDMTPIEKAYQWQSYDKTETYLYPVNQHCMVLCGFDDENYYFSDPLSAETIVIFPMKTAEEIFKSMGTQAVAILKTAE
ncbi:MAG: C39 family peptidase, partial [Candidatus Fimenecus sp.]